MKRAPYQTRDPDKAEMKREVLGASSLNEIVVSRNEAYEFWSQTSRGITITQSISSVQTANYIRNRVKETASYNTLEAYFALIRGTLLMWKLQIHNSHICLP